MSRLGADGLGLPVGGVVGTSVYGAWTAYTPTWSGTISNGTLTGAYQRIGRTVTWRISILWGSTTTHPASTQTLTLPFLGNNVVGYGYANPASTPVGVVVSVATGTLTITMRSSNTPGTLFSNLAPATWNVGSTLDVTGTYEAQAD